MQQLSINHSTATAQPSPATYTDSRNNYEKFIQFLSTNLFSSSQPTLENQLSEHSWTASAISSRNKPNVCVEIDSSSCSLKRINGPANRFFDVLNTIKLFVSHQIFITLSEEQQLIVREKLSSDSLVLKSILESPFKQMSAIGVLIFVRDYLNKCPVQKMDTSLIGINSLLKADVHENPGQELFDKFTRLSQAGSCKETKIIPRPFVFPATPYSVSIQGIKIPIFPSAEHIVLILLDLSHEKPLLIYYDPQGISMDDPSRLESIPGFNLKTHLQDFANRMGADFIEVKIKNQTDAINCGVHLLYLLKEIANRDISLLDLIVEFDYRCSMSHVRANLLIELCKGPDQQKEEQLDDWVGEEDELKGTQEEIPVEEGKLEVSPKGYPLNALF